MIPRVEILRWLFQNKSDSLKWTVFLQASDSSWRLHKSWPSLGCGGSEEASKTPCRTSWTTAQTMISFDDDQGWPLTQFFLFPFWEKSLIFLSGKLMTLQRGNTILLRSSQQLPRLRLGLSKGFLSWHGALLGPWTRLVRCFRNYRDTRTPSCVLR